MYLYFLTSLKSDIYSPETRKKKNLLSFLTRPGIGVGFWQLLSNQLILLLRLHALEEMHKLSVWFLLSCSFIVPSGFFLLLVPFPPLVLWHYFYIK